MDRLAPSIGYKKSPWLLISSQIHTPQSPFPSLFSCYLSRFKTTNENHQNHHNNPTFFPLFSSTRNHPTHCHLPFPLFPSLFSLCHRCRTKKKPKQRRCQSCSTAATSVVGNLHHHRCHLPLTTTLLPSCSINFYGISQV